MKRKRMTIADFRAQKGKRQMTMLFVETLDEAAAAAAAGIDVLSIVETLWTPAMRFAGGEESRVAMLARLFEFAAAGLVLAFGLALLVSARGAA